MYISRIYIKNFRNFKDFDLFIPNGNPLTVIGGNNAGKTNLLKAIRLVLDHQLLPWERKLTEDDFSWGLGNKPWENGEEVVITLTLSGIKSGEESNEFIHSLVGKTFDDEDNESELFNANISYVYGPEFKRKEGLYNLYDDYRAFLVSGKYHPSGFEYDQEGNRKKYPESFKSYYAGLVKEDYSDFYKYFYLDPSILERLKEKDYDKGGIEAKYSYGVYTSRIKKRINLLYLDALRDVTKNFFDGYHSVVSQLLRLKISLDEKSDKEFYDELTEGFNMLRENALQDSSGQVVLKNSKQIFDETETVLRSDGLNLLGNKAHLKIGTPKINNSTISRYFNFLTDLVEENKEGVNIDTLGLGYQNLAYMSSIFAIFELKKFLEVGEDRDDHNRIFFNVLLTEEPEAHLDVQNQKHLHTEIENKTKQLGSIKQNKNGEEEIISTNVFTQVIQTSHSTHLTAKSKLENIIVLEKHGSNSTAVNVDQAIKSNNSSYEHDRRIIHQYLDATRSSMLFANKVILVEGPSEEYALPAIIDFYFNNKKSSSYEEGLELVNIGFKGFDSFYSLYGDQGSKLNNICLGLADGDYHLDRNVKEELKLSDIYSQKNIGSKKSANVYEQKNIYTFEVDTFFLPDPSDLSTNNIDWLKAILTRLHKEGKYYSSESDFEEKIKMLDNFYSLVSSEKLNNEKGDSKSLKNFFTGLLTREVSKPVISLYLASLIKAKHLNDFREIDSWDSELLENLNDFEIPLFIVDGLEKIIDSEND